MDLVTGGSSRPSWWPRPGTPARAALAGAVAASVLWGGAEQPAAKAAVLTALLRRPGTRYDISTPSVVTVR